MRPFVALVHGLIVASIVTLAGCTGVASKSAAKTPWNDARQLVLVTTSDWNATTGTLRRYEREGSAWREAGSPTPITVGRSGSAWGIGLHPAQPDGLQKQEGDGRAPAGVFRIGTAFGYADIAATGWPYQGMSASDWCIDVPASPLYNRIVDAKTVGDAAVEGSTEPMRRDLHANGDVRYKLGFVIEHNPGNRSAAGSCIFAHLWRAPGEPTAGCTAMPEPAMRELLAWLDPRRKPVFALLPDNELERLHAAWDLPAPARAR
ncbi:L,D-transpeptidase family protein [Lysobacter auxotrophicus]|uniref:L,D-transpeptidase family protein n=1 Tax=Lysobacter auxotrophicus TaxID=2992573 RepID=A0ABM8DF06_9GAMM|nr:L,D-transpeptidase family protein [Lysobacter auxotrophicus]BDU17194.1 L,D-transpeptidase family protein [Lysobacter auxotrophicus]